jgi:hypothetical protein
MSKFIEIKEIAGFGILAFMELCLLLFQRANLVVRTLFR